MNESEGRERSATVIPRLVSTFRLLVVAAIGVVAAVADVVVVALAALCILLETVLHKR